MTINEAIRFSTKQQGRKVTVRDLTQNDLSSLRKKADGWYTYRDPSFGLGIRATGGDDSGDAWTLWIELDEETYREMTAKNLTVAQLIAFEMQLVPDAQRCVRDERMKLQVAIASKDERAIAIQSQEATRVARIWGHDEESN